MTVQVYHNPKCSKSRKALEVLEEKGVNYETKEYLKEGLTQNEVSTILSALDTEPKTLVRVKEELFKELSKDIDTEADIIELLCEHPKLLERPVLIKNGSAIIARPTEKIFDFLK